MSSFQTSNAWGLSMGAEIQVSGTLHLDERDSEGGRGEPLKMSHRLMAQAPDGSIWYGFVIVSHGEQSLDVGKSARVGIAFLDEEGARSAFPLNVPIRFGDGVKARGTIELHCYATR